MFSQVKRTRVIEPEAFKKLTIYQKQQTGFWLEETLEQEQEQAPEQAPEQVIEEPILEFEEVFDAPDSETDLQQQEQEQAQAQEQAPEQVVEQQLDEVSLNDSEEVPL